MRFTTKEFTEWGAIERVLLFPILMFIGSLLLLITQTVVFEHTTPEPRFAEVMKLASWTLFGSIVLLIFGRPVAITTAALFYEVRSWVVAE